MVYLDNAATTIDKPPEVAQAVLAALHEIGNAGRGVNENSLDAARTVFQTRVLLAEFFHAEDASRIAFTSNATEALNIAILGLFEPGDHVITTVTEHNSVLRPLYVLQQQGVEVTFLPCDSKGTVRPEQFEEAIKHNTKGIICAHASNVTGNVLDISSVGQIAEKHGLLLVVDAAQTAGVMDIDVQKMRIAVLCFTGHKGLLGPQGTGGIYVRPGVAIRPLKSGGTGVQTYLKRQPEEMPTLLEAGTLNGHGIAGLGAAITYLNRVGLDSIREKEMELMWHFYNGITCIPGIEVYGDFDSPRRCGIVSLNLQGMDSAEVGDELYMNYGISVRTGAHCAPRMHEALGTVGTGTVRFSFSHRNTLEEVDMAICALRELAGGS